MIMLMFAHTNKGIASYHMIKDHKINGLMIKDHMIKDHMINDLMIMINDHMWSYNTKVGVYSDKQPGIIMTTSLVREKPYSL